MSTEKKPVLVFTFPGCMGGVSSFNRNIINHTSLRDRVYIKVILINPVEDKRPRFDDPIHADEVLPFSFSNLENEYYTAKKLSALIGDEQAWVITDNKLTLNAVSQFRYQRKLIYLVHDYFYVNWALQYAKAIDGILTHSSFFRDILISAAPHFREKTTYLPYGVEVPAAAWTKRAPAQPLKLVFLGRLTTAKGVLLLKDIDNLLQQSSVTVSWTIVGKGELKEQLQHQWQLSDNIQFIEAKDTKEVFRILEEQDVLVFPSHFEGTPVAIMEAMSRAVIPVVSDLPGGTRDMVTAETGFRCDTMSAAAYANAIITLHKDLNLVSAMQQRCITAVRNNFDVNKAADSYVQHILSVTAKQRQQPGKMLNISRLDKPVYPNWVVYPIRKLFSK